MNIPDYIEEEISKYRYERKNNIYCNDIFNNIMLFINLAQLNNRLNEKEAQEIRQMVNSL